jgi:hypothetical protein
MIEKLKATIKNANKHLGKYLLVLLIGLIAGYFTGSHIGRIFGAQQYVKKLWRKNELNISSLKVSEKIDLYRIKNDLTPFEETSGLCKYAEFRAGEVAEKHLGEWDPKEQKYNSMDDPNELHISELSDEQAQELCPECDFKTQVENIYITARPEVCSNPSIDCGNDDEFGVVENYTDMVFNGWVNSKSHKDVLLSPIENGCVRSVGGVVVLEIAKINN